MRSVHRTRQRSLFEKGVKDYAKDKLVLVELDFPQAKALPEKQAKQNERLHMKHKVEGFPTVLFLDGSGKELGRLLGYEGEGPAAFIAKIEKFTKNTASK